MSRNGKWLRVALIEVVRNESTQMFVAVGSIGLMLGVLLGGWGGILG